MKLFSLQAVLFLLGAIFALGEDVLVQQKGESASNYLKRLEKAGNEGNAVAFYKMGEAYEDGIITPKDEKIALTWYQKSAEGGYHEGFTRVGYFYDKGIGTVPNFEKAFEYFKDGAKLGNYYAAYNMGLAYEKGRGVERNIEQSKYWFEKAYEFGNLNQKVSVGKYYMLTYKDTPYEARGFKILEDAATNHDHTEAQRFLGTSYYLLDRTYNAERAFYWLQKAAAKGNALAIVYLGKMYYRGDNPPKVDMDKAQELFQKAADMGNAEGVCNLGAVYLDRGKDDPLMLSKGVQNLEKAAQMGDGTAQFLLGRLYLKGTHGVSQDYAKAAAYFQMSADSDNPDGQFELACLYYEGNGVPEDGKLMVKWLKASAAQGNASAQKLLADLTEVGKARAALGKSVLDAPKAPAQAPAAP